MYFLNGDHIYIKPGRGLASVSEELRDCFEQLEHINEGKKIFRLDFFARTGSVEEYQELNNYIARIVEDTFSWPVIFSLIAQAPFTGNVIVEAFYYDSALWQFNKVEDSGGEAIIFRRGDVEVLAGSVREYSRISCRENAKEAFSSVGRLLDKTGFPVNAIVRQWNYIENILGREDDEQKYQVFNNIRSRFYADHFIQNGYPSATGIGMDFGGIIIEFIAVKSGVHKTFSLNNPLQKAAHHYSEKVLEESQYSIRSTPKFERARYLEMFDRKLIFISGTASIRGEKTVAEGDPEKQTEVTIQNIEKLYSEDVLVQIGYKSLRPVYGHARIYIKNRNDFRKIRKIFRSYYGNLPAVYLVADICREKLLVEIEGQVILEANP
jgi:enamine deaminase RidA (YjgF/YER057c/UK114 family)